VCRYITLWNVCDQWRDQWNAATVCPAQWRSPCFDCCVSSTVIGHLLKGTPNSVIDWNQVCSVWGPQCQARWTWRSHAAGTPVCSSASWEPRLTANITVNMFSVAVYYLTSVQDASATPGPCSMTAHRHTLLGTHWTLLGVPFSRWLECVVQQQGGHIEHLM